MPVDEVLYYGTNGSLYPWDIRHDAGLTAFCDPRLDGSVCLRVHTEPGFAEVNLIYNDGEARVMPLVLWGETARFQYWEVVITPTARRLRYGFALKRVDGTVVYRGRSGEMSGLEFFYQLDLDIQQPVTTPAWMQGAVVYQIFPERFADGNPANNPSGCDPWGAVPHWMRFQGGDLTGITQRLDYLQDLGVDLIYLNPIFTAPTNHKYDTIDYYQVDPAFGGNEALRGLVEGAHARGMCVILDASFNHCHPAFFAFQDIVKHGRDSRYWDWFTIYDHPIEVRVRSHKLPWWLAKNKAEWQVWLAQFEQMTGIRTVFLEDDGPGIQPTYDGWFNNINMPKINLSNPETRAYFLEVAAYWVREFKVDGWRMDVVPHVIDDFWVDMRKTLRAINPDAYMIAEVWGNVSFWLQGDRFDGTMNYTFRQLAIDYFAAAEQDTESFLDGCTHMLMTYPAAVTAVNHNLLSSHDTMRFLRAAGENRERLRLGTFFQFVMPGAPGIYYGDEIGMTGGHDPDCRQAFPWDHEDRWDLEQYAQVKTLAQLRRAHPALRIGDWQRLWAGEEAFAFLRRHQGEQVLVVIARKQPLENQFISLQTAAPTTLFGQALWEPRPDGLYMHHLPAWSGVVIKL